MASSGSERPRICGKPSLLSEARTRGQMTVELAVCIPVILAVIGLALNVLGYLNACARFDRVAAEAVRTQATSPGYGEEGSALAAGRVRETIESAFKSDAGEGFDCDISVTATVVGLGGESAHDGEGFSISMLARLERYDCSVTYQPWPFNRLSFLQFFKLTHIRSYTIDPFRPGVLF